VSRSALSPSKRGYKSGRETYKHIEIAERAFGRRLPAGVVVHHFDNDTGNNSNGNLVICPSQAYHFLLHRRQRAVEAGFPAHYLRCHACKSYGDPAQMYVYEKKGSAVHVSCQSRLNRERKAA
jgi:hypothetical protein